MLWIIAIAPVAAAGLYYIKTIVDEKRAYFRIKRIRDKY